MLWTSGRLHNKDACSKNYRPPVAGKSLAHLSPVAVKKQTPQKYIVAYVLIYNRPCFLHICNTEHYQAVTVKNTACLSCLFEEPSPEAMVFEKQYMAL